MQTISRDHEAILTACSESLEDGFCQMVMQPIQLASPHAKNEGRPQGSISGTIGLSGTQPDGHAEVKIQLSLVFQDAQAHLIYRSMMMLEPTDPVEPTELQDIVGELSNITAGGAKTRLSEHGYRLTLSLPTVAVGPNHYLGSPPGIQFCMIYPVQLDGDTFYMEISIS